MSVFPHSWIFFTSFLLISFLLIISFLMSVIDEIIKKDLKFEKKDTKIDMFAKNNKSKGKSIKKKTV